MSYVQYNLITFSTSTKLFTLSGMSTFWMRDLIFSIGGNRDC